MKTLKCFQQLADKHTIVWIMAENNIIRSTRTVGSNEALAIGAISQLLCAI